MTTQTSDNNKRIAKNTIYLYARMLVSMLLGVYTSRLVLEALGATDFGIYNVVGGIVIFLNFLNATLVASTQRFLNISLGENVRDHIRDTYNASVKIHFALSVIIVIVAESVGVWVVNSLLNRPQSRMFAANMIFQFSVLSVFFSINMAPCQAIIIAKEKMKYYAMYSIFDVIAKFIFALALLSYSDDKLIFYGLSFSLIGIVDYLLYRITCKRQFEICRGSNKVKDKTIYKSMLSFSGWALIGSLAGVLSNQGTNMLLNVFSGPVVNAARGLAMTFNGYVYSFVTNFTIAFTPQLIQNYAAKRNEEMYSLLLNSIKYSIFLFSFFALPVLFETKFILGVWLKDVPTYTDIFCQIIICESFISCAERPMATVCNAIGCVKQVNLSVGVIYLVAFVLSWIVLSQTKNVIWPFVIHAIAIVIGVILFLYYIGVNVLVDKFRFFKVVVFRSLFTLIIPILLLVLVRKSMDDGWLRFFAIGAVSTSSILFSIYTIGINSNERKNFQLIIKQKLCLIKS